MLLFPHLGRPAGPIAAAKRPDNNAARPDKQTARLFSLAAHQDRSRQALLRRGRQRLRAVGETVQVSDHVGALAILRDAGKAHRGARDSRLGIGDELVERIEVPGAALGLHRSREVEAAAALANMVADDAVEVRTDTVRSAF